MIVERSRSPSGIDRASIVDALDEDFKWINPDVKMQKASLEWQNQENLTRLKDHCYRDQGDDYWEGIRFVPLEDDERPCSFDSSKFFIFYAKIIETVGVKPPFSAFQHSVMRAINACPSQLTSNAWFILICFELLSYRLGGEPHLDIFQFFCTYSSQKANTIGWVHLTQRTDRKFLKNLKSSVKHWKDSIFKVVVNEGYKPFWINKEENLVYPVKWVPPQKQPRARDFDSLPIDHQNLICKMLALGPFGAKHLHWCWLNSVLDDFVIPPLDEVRFADIKAKLLKNAMATGSGPTASDKAGSDAASEGWNIEELERTLLSSPVAELQEVEVLEITAPKKRKADKISSPCEVDQHSSKSSWEEVISNDPSEGVALDYASYLRDKLQSLLEDVANLGDANVRAMNELKKKFHMAVSYISVQRNKINELNSQNECLKKDLEISLQGKEFAEKLVVTLREELREKEEKLNWAWNVSQDMAAEISKLKKRLVEKQVEDTEAELQCCLGIGFQ